MCAKFKLILTYCIDMLCDWWIIYEFMYFHIFTLLYARSRAFVSSFFLFKILFCFACFIKFFISSSLFFLVHVFRDTNFAFYWIKKKKKFENNSNIFVFKIDNLKSDKISIWQLINNFVWYIQRNLFKKSKICWFQQRITS